MTPVTLLFHDVFVRDPRESGFSSPAADRYKLSAAEFDAQLAGIHVGSRTPAVRVTVDDGGLSYWTLVADRLERMNLRGYCFVSTAVIGTQGFLRAEHIRALDSRGHIIGSHSASHPARFSALSPSAMRREWSASRDRLEHILGHAVTTASVPGGYFSKDVARAAADCGIELLFTSEPVRSLQVVDGCTVAGRFTVRRGARRNRSKQLVSPAPWARCSEWASWNIKGIVKPLLGSSYPQVAEWIHGGLR